MRIIATCMAGNEADILEAFVRHHAALLDAVVVLDHASIDATPAILAGLAGEGLPLKVFRDNERAFRQGERMTWMAKRFLVELDADYCFALDADELVKAPSREALEEALRRLPPRTHGLVTLQNYFGAGDAPAEVNPVRRLTHRMARERSPARKVVLARGFAEDASAQVSLGNHAAVSVRGGRAQPLAHALVEGAFRAHYPVRSPQQVARKALLGWLSHRLTLPERYLGAAASGKVIPAGHWRDMFQRLASGSLQVDEHLVEEAINVYAGGGAPVRSAEIVEDPLPAAYELRYTHPTQLSALGALAAWTDRLVSDVNAGRLERSEAR